MILGEFGNWGDRMSLKIQLFENQRIRTAWDEEKEEWYFSIVDVVGVLTDSVDPTAYWRKLKQRLKAEGNETVTNCHGLKMTAPDGKKRLTDVADTEQLLRIIQAIPSPKAEPFKLWLAQVGRERVFCQVKIPGFAKANSLVLPREFPGNCQINSLVLPRYFTRMRALRRR